MLHFVFRLMYLGETGRAIEKQFLEPMFYGWFCSSLLAFWGFTIWNRLQFRESYLVNHGEVYWLLPARVERKLSSVS